MARCRTRRPASPSARRCATGPARSRRCSGSTSTSPAGRGSRPVAEPLTARAERKTRLEGTHLLVRAGEYACALPLSAVRRAGGEPLPVLNLARLVNASPGANPSYPVTVVIWVGPAEAREMIGFAAD